MECISTNRLESEGWAWFIGQSSGCSWLGQANNLVTKLPNEPQWVNRHARPAAPIWISSGLHPIRVCIEGSVRKVPTQSRCRIETYSDHIYPIDVRIVVNVSRAQWMGSREVRILARQKATTRLVKKKVGREFAKQTVPSTRCF